MLVTPLRVFLFLIAAFVAAAGTAWYTGALDRYFASSQPRIAQGSDTKPDAEKAPAPDSGTAEKGAAADRLTKPESKPAEGKAADASRPGEPTAESKPATSDDKAAPAGKSQAAGDSGSAASTAKGEDKTAETPEAAPKDTKDSALVIPGFDVVRVQPDGGMVVAGRAAPNSTVEVVTGSTVLGTTKSGPGGDFAVVLDDPLKPGNYQIVLRASEPGAGSATSKETAVVSVPDSPDGDVLALVEEPGKPSRLITAPKAKEGAAQETASADAGKAATAPAPKAGAQPEKTETKPADSEIASAEPKAGSAPLAEGKIATFEPKADEKANVFIEAVEIDGKDIFVAGGGAAGQRVRVYANDILLGEALVSPGGRFLVQAARDLPVGDYIVRADLLSANGSDVVARAAVPFEREPGEKLAAVAPQKASAGAASGTSQASASGASASSSSASPQGQAVASADKGGMQLPDLNNGLADSAPVVTEPKLQSVDGAVIIRRGDTLWQISRRVYGHGVRYSTIYLANQNQIRDPDMIWPGQVFSVPQKTDKGEQADMKAIGDQAVPIPDEATSTD